MTDFYISLSHSDRGSTLRCEGELDLFTATRLDEAVEICLARQPKAFQIDATAVTLLTSAGIKSLLAAATRCHDEGITFRLTASGHARRVLDLVGLWWLGIVDDGVRLESAMRDALSSYARLRYEGRIAERPGS